VPTFWRWFGVGSGGVPGFRRLLNVWLLLHLLIGSVAATLINTELHELAQDALLPLLAILVGLTFSWAGNAHALMQSEEIVEYAKKKAGGMPDYVFTFQLCILINVVTICLWAIPTLNIPYPLSSAEVQSVLDWASKAMLFALTSLAIRTGWHAVLGANMLLLMRVGR
jgi:hypothetical protein